MRTHGIRATYISGCRCAECREANALYQRTLWHSKAKQQDRKEAKMNKELYKILTSGDPLLDTPGEPKKEWPTPTRTPLTDEEFDQSYLHAFNWALTSIWAGNRTGDSHEYACWLMSNDDRDWLLNAGHQFAYQAYQKEMETKS